MSSIQSTSSPSLLGNLAQALELLRQTCAAFTNCPFYYGSTDGAIEFPAGFVQMINSESAGFPSREFDQNGNELVSTLYESLVQLTFVTKQGRTERTKIANRSLAFRIVSNLMNAPSNESFKTHWEINRRKINTDLRADVLRVGQIRDISDFGLKRGSGNYNTLQFDFFLSVVDTLQLAVPCFTPDTGPDFRVRVERGN